MSFAIKVCPSLWAPPLSPSGNSTDCIADLTMSSDHSPKDDSSTCMASAACRQTSQIESRLGEYFDMVLKHVDIMLKKLCRGLKDILLVLETETQISACKLKAFEHV